MSDAPPAGTPAATPAHGTSAPAAAEAKPAQVTGRRGRRESVDVLWHYCAYLVVNTCRGNYMIIIDGVTDILITRDVSQYVSFYNDPPRPPQNKKVTEFLKTILGRPVVVKLNSGVDYRGVLACLDSFMNIAMEQTEEYVQGQLKAKYGDCFIRGNNVLYISAQKRR